MIGWISMGSTRRPSPRSTVSVALLILMFEADWTEQQVQELLAHPEVSTTEIFISKTTTYRGHGSHQICMFHVSLCFSANLTHFVVPLAPPSPHVLRKRREG